MRRKHVPQRTCISCRATKPKRELVRVVRTPEGALVVDETGRRNGRGAYLCRERACWQRALKERRIAAALKVELGADEIRVLNEYVETL